MTVCGFKSSTAPCMEVEKMLMAEAWKYLRLRKRFWLAPILAILTLFSALVFVTKGSTVAPFIYALY